MTKKKKKSTRRRVRLPLKKAKTKRNTRSARRNSSLAKRRRAVRRRRNASIVQKFYIVRGKKKNPVAIFTGAKAVGTKVAKLAGKLVGSPMALVPIPKGKK